MLMKFVSIVIVALAALVGCSDRAPGLGEVLYFDIPKGEAKDTLVLVANEAHVEIMFSLSDVDGVLTPAIKGRYQLEEVFEKMLVDTGIEFVVSGSSGTFSVKRKKQHSSTETEKGGVLFSFSRPIPLNA